MEKRPEPQVVEELFESRPTGVEAQLDEDSPAESHLARPYDPSLIRVDPKMFSLRNILDMISEGDLDLAPDFQRLSVWKSWQKSRLIESVLLRIPLPAFYFSSDSDGRLIVVDGVQRLTTIFEFVRGGHDGKHWFPLTDLEYLEQQVGNKSFRELDGTIWSKRIHSTQIVANVIDPQTPTPVKFDIFRRINTGGTPLTAQEIRHCMSGPTSRNLLKTLAESQEFSRATGGKLKGHPRMADREMVLRVLAFRILDIFSEQDPVSLESMLDATTERIDKELTKVVIESLQTEFLRSMKLAWELFGEHAFRKWPTGQDRLYPINRALFEVWGVVLCDADRETIMQTKDEIVTKFRALLSNDVFFDSAISTGTADPKKIAYRFSSIRELLKGISR